MKKHLGHIFCALLLLSFSSVSFAAEARFGWAPNSESNLAGYKIYCGTESRVYGPPVDQKMGTTVPGMVIGTVPDLQAGQTYFCAATAYDTDGSQSDFSNEVSFVAADQVYPAAPAAMQVVVMRRNPDGTVDLFEADGDKIAVGVKLP